MEFRQSQNFGKCDLGPPCACRRSRPALPAPWPLRSRADALQVHSLGGLDGARSSADHGDDSFPVIQPTGRVGLGGTSCTRCGTHDLVGMCVLARGTIDQEVSSLGGTRLRCPHACLQPLLIVLRVLCSGAFVAGCCQDSPEPYPLVWHGFFGSAVVV